MTEVRPADLRFSRDETREPLDRAGVTLSDAEARRPPDPERFVREFSDSERTGARYLKSVTALLGAFRWTAQVVHLDG